jgi:glycosyltransferase involved in cell wall biosynthesis
MMIEVSVIICSHNPRPAYFERALESLRAQTLAQEKWELLLVDNASQNPLSRQWDLSWQSNARHLQENELGLAPARRAGMRAAVADLLVFVDDDNVLDARYLEEALRIKNERPDLGVWGSGAIIPEFETQPSASVEVLLSYLALRETAEPRWGHILPCADVTPWGAGMCVRAAVAAVYLERYRNIPIPLVGRRGRILMSGEDVELCYLACDCGFSVGVFPSLKIKHLIPKERVSKKYLIRLYEGTLTSNMILAYNWTGLTPASSSSGLRRLLSLCKQMLTLRGIKRGMHLASLRATASARRLITEREYLR